MKEKILIVEDQFIEANHLRIMLQRAEYSVCGIARSVEQAEKMIEKEIPGLVLLDIFLNGNRTGIELAAQLRDENIPFIYLSANSNEDVLNAAKATHPNGFLVKPFREKDLLIAIEIARYHHEHGLESKLRKEALFQKQLNLPKDELADYPQRLLSIAKTIQPLISFDYMIAGYFSGQHFVSENTLHFLRAGFDEYQILDIKGLQMVCNLSINQLESINDQTHLDGRMAFYNGEEFKKQINMSELSNLISRTFKMSSQLTLPLPLSINNHNGFQFLFFSRRPDSYNEEHLALCIRLQPLLIKAIAVAAHAKLGKPAESEIDYIPEPYQAIHNNTFEGIIGRSHLLLNVFDLINQVAPSDTSVLITGESGTGKERVAEVVHTLSHRKSKPLVKVNCAALPINLIESELFGHEKGAFTGAFEKRIGKFEQANHGTIFLDEIGDMPLEAQVKLLRVLQQREIERIGGKAPVKVNIRVIAATNRNLEKEVAEGRFRLDLYYRLNVFPIHLPALAERKQDIPLLVNHFISYYGHKTGRKHYGISDKALKSLMEYHWPGNIRELENVIERSVLMSKDSIIDHITLPAQYPKDLTNLREEIKLKTIFDNERDYIIEVLRKCNGRIRGADGAAAILNIPPTTLGSKMKKLGIKRDYVI
jgi:DNA-binding NtrC family response regulator